MVCNFYSNIFFHFNKLEIFFVEIISLLVCIQYTAICMLKILLRNSNTKRSFLFAFFQGFNYLTLPTSHQRTQDNTHIFNLRFSRKCFLKFMTSLSGLNDKDLKNGKKKFKGHIHTQFFIFLLLLKEKKTLKSKRPPFLFLSIPLFLINYT